MIKIIIDKKSNKPLYAQVRDHIQDGISKGELANGDKLPSVSALAKQAGVTQATIRRAMEDLTRQGLTHSHVGRGTFVGVPPESGITGSQHANTGPNQAAQRLRQGISKGLCDLMTAASRPGIKDFSKGVPDPWLLPHGLFKKMVTLAMEAPDNDYLSYGDLNGLLPLRETIAERYKSKGVHITPDQVLITIGAQQGACIAALDAAQKNRQVLVESPGFQGIVDAFVSHGNPVETIVSGTEMVTRLAGRTQDRSCLLSLCPDFQSPTGETASEAVRKKIADWGRQSKRIVLSDEIYQDLRLDGTPPEPMINLLGHGSGRTIIISSLSKSLIPGLRLGWMISSTRRITEFRRLKRLMAQTGPPLMQGVALAFLRSGAYDEHLENIRNIYRERRDAMLSCLDQLMPQGVSWTRPQGGFSLWVSLPSGYSSVALLISVLDKGINLVPGPIFDMDQRFVNSFRLSWAWTDVEQIMEGMEILADSVKEMLRRPPGDSGLSGLGHF